MGNSSSWGGNLTINHAVMQDCIDSQAVQAALEGAGISFLAGLRQLMDHTRVVAVMAKAEASSTGSVRGLRHTMLDDSDIQVCALVHSCITCAMCVLGAFCAK